VSVYSARSSITFFREQFKLFCPERASFKPLRDPRCSVTRLSQDFAIAFARGSMRMRVIPSGISAQAFRYAHIGTSA
jgi:hypothetical protein